MSPKTFLSSSLFFFNDAPHLSSSFAKAFAKDECKYFYLNITLYGELKHNLGLIIGTVEYQNLIEDIFFNEYINNGLCHKNKALINDFNEDKINYTYYFF